MSIPLRIQLSNCMYHIIVRGNNRGKIFWQRKDYQLFLGFLDQASKKFEVKIYTYCLLPNHYHLQIETLKPNLIPFMHWLNMKYVININFIYHRTGHLFEGRYKSIVVDKDAYALSLNRYIHLNPVKAGLCKSAEDYIWSSMPIYLGNQADLISLDCTFILEYFGKDRKKSVRLYKDYIQEGLSFNNNDLHYRVKGDLILGNEQFINKIENRIGKSQLDPVLYTQLKKLRKAGNLHG